jgi:hypothetical protein
MNRREFLESAAACPAALAAQADNGTELFDGRSLSGWIVEEGPESAFHVVDGAITGAESSQYPAWLRSERQFGNFDFRCEFFVRGWIDGGVYVHAPRHGRPAANGLLIKIFHQVDKVPKSNSMGAVFPLVAPKTVNVRNQGEWNTMRILMDWPRLNVWVNDEVVQDLDLSSHPELRHRFRRGHMGLSALGYPIRFRNLHIRELPNRESWEDLYAAEGDFQRWFVSESSKNAPARFEALGGVIRAGGGGHLATRDTFQDFELSLFVRGPREHNGGILVRSEGKGLSGSRYYEIQLHNVEEAHFPTGSLYFHKRSIYPRIENDKWFPMQIRLQGTHCLVRVNGDTVLEYEGLENREAGHIELQAHRPGSWLEFKDIRVLRL